jgi:uncharacterized protein YndB with AHSA1/START domain
MKDRWTQAAGSACPRRTCPRRVGRLLNRVNCSQPNRVAAFDRLRFAEIHALKIDELRKLAERGEMIPDASISASAEILISAPLEMVWSIMVDVNNWPSWYPYLQNARLYGAFLEGAQLTYGGLIKHKLALGQVQPLVTAMTYGRMLIYDGITRWDFAPLVDQHTKVTFTETSAGFLINRLYSDKALHRHICKWLGALKVEAERRATHG